MTRPPAIAVSVTWKPEPWAARFRALAPEREVVVVVDAATPVPARHHLFCWKPTREVLRRDPAPLMICSGGAGVDHILKNDPPAGVPIVRIVDPDLTGRMVEYVALHALFHLRRMTGWPARQAARRWASPPLATARETTVGILGVGELGQASAKALMALGFDVIGWGRSRREGLGFPAYAGAGELDAFLARTDILVGLLPSTPETRGILNRDLFARLRRDGPFGAPVLINAGRGDAANEAELAAALADGTLAAASLDVFVAEPLPQDSPFWGLPNVVVTPHNAADSHPDAVAAAAMEEIRRFEAGEPPMNPVDLARGY